MITNQLGLTTGLAVWLLVGPVPDALAAATSSLRSAPAGAALPPRSMDVPADDADDLAEDMDEIVVSGMRPRGAVITPIPAEARFDRTVICALGADSVADVVEAFAPQARALNRGGDPILLLNGRRIADRGEIEDLPPEAIRSVEIFPEAVAIQYGYPPDQRVVNVILRKRYRAVTVAAKSDVAIGQGRSTYRLVGNALALSPEGRTSIDLQGRRREAVLDRKAPNTVGKRSRLPREDRLQGRALWQRRLGDLNVTASGVLTNDISLWNLGRNDLGDPLRRRDTTLAGKLGLTFAGDAGVWQWSVQSTADVERRRIMTRAATGALDPEAWRSLTSHERSFRMEGNIGGPLADFGTGQIVASLTAGINREIYHAYDRADPARTHASQTNASTFASLNVPLLRDDKLALFGDGRADAYSQGPLRGQYDIGARASPFEGFTASATWAQSRKRPGFGTLAQVPLSTPNVRVYDYLAGRQPYIDLVTGGNPALRDVREDRLDMRLTLKPFTARNITASLEYSDRKDRNRVSGLLEPTPSVEAAFAGRFERDGQGNLVAFDARPVSMARGRTRVLRSGLNMTVPLGAATAAAATGRDKAQDAPPTAAELAGKPARLPPPGQFQVALYHTYTLRDDVLLAEGQPWLDLLRGDGVSGLGGTPRHRLEMQAGYASRRFGLRLAGDWRSAMHIDGITSATGLRFASRFTLDARLFVNLRMLGAALGQDWIKGKLNLSVDNLLGTRNKIRDMTGETVRLYRDDSETSGRTMRLTFRKIFR